MHNLKSGLLFIMNQYTISILRALFSGKSFAFHKDAANGEYEKAAIELKENCNLWLSVENDNGYRTITTPVIGWKSN